MSRLYRCEQMGDVWLIIEDGKGTIASAVSEEEAEGIVEALNQRGPRIRFQLEREAKP